MKKVGHTLDFEQRSSELSQRQWCQENDVPRSTLQNWLARKDNIDSDTDVIHFFESPSGLCFLHRLIIALHFVFTKVGVASTHNVSEFLRLSGLSAFVAASKTTQKKISGQMNTKLAEFAQEEIEQLVQRHTNCHLLNDRIKFFQFYPALGGKLPITTLFFLLRSCSMLDFFDHSTFIGNTPIQTLSA